MAVNNRYNFPNRVANSFRASFIFSMLLVTQCPSGRVCDQGRRLVNCWSRREVSSRSLQAQTRNRTRLFLPCHTALILPFGFDCVPFCCSFLVDLFPSKLTQPDQVCTGYFQLSSSGRPESLHQHQSHSCRGLGLKSSFPQTFICLGLPSHWAAQ